MPLNVPTAIPPIGEQTDPTKVRVAAIVGGQLGSAPARGFGFTPAEITAIEILTTTGGGGGGGGGDMYKAVYDTDNDGKVNVAESADAVAWANVSGKPATFPPSNHSHVESDVVNLVSDLALKAPLASPALTGTPTAPTATAGTATTQIASTAFVGAAVTAAAVPAPATVNPLMDGAVAVGTTVKYAREDHRHPVDTSREPTLTAGTTAQYYRGDKSWQTLDKAAVGLGSVDNTSDAGKPVSTATQTALNLKENTANKGAASGYAPLDASSKVPAINLPAYVDDVVEYANLAAFPVTGVTGLIYVALDTNKVYRWSGSAYVEISPSPGSTDAVPEGSTNLYYTTARATSAAIAAIPPATVAPLMDGVAAVGAVAKYAKEDHKHPSDTAKLDASAYTAADVLTKIKTVDGTGSLLDADLLDGLNSTAFATATHSHAQTDVTNLISDLALKAPLASPALTGNPTAPTPSVGDTDTSIATTAFVMAAVAAGGGGGGTVAIADGPPASPTAGTMWFESDTGHTFIWYVDPGGPPGQWLQINAGAMGPQGITGSQGLQGIQGVKGDTGEVPEAPSDSGEYVRVNGVWRLIRQSFDTAGKITQDIPVPTWGPTQARLTTYTLVPSTSNTLAWRISTDGTTFPSGASDYADGGWYHTSSGAGAFGNSSLTARSYWYGGVASFGNVPFQMDLVVVLVRSTSALYFSFRSSTTDWTSSSMNHQMQSGYAGGAVFGTGLAIKALRWFTVNATPVPSFGKIVVEWLP